MTPESTFSSLEVVNATDKSPKPNPTKLLPYAYLTGNIDAAQTNTVQDPSHSTWQ